MKGISLMEKVKRNERVSAIVEMLSDNPNKIFTLSYFSDLFGSAKSTISEDVAIAQDSIEKYSLGKIETVPGAAGGVKYIPYKKNDCKKFVEEICSTLRDGDRILPGGFLYMLDVLSHPATVSKMGEMLAMEFYKTNPDFVLTIETKGIPVALMAAKSLNIPLLIARRDAKISDGSAVSINYVTGTAGRIQTMSLPKRAVSNGQRALIIDDFMKGGGSAKGLADMMKEFAISVVGVGVVMATKHPEAKRVKEYKSLMELINVDEINRTVDVRPSEWI